MNLLVVVEERFELSDGALHLVPAVPFEVANQASLKQGDQLELRRPDGSVITTTLYSSFDWLVPSHGRIGLGINGLSKKDVPVGTEVWKVGL